MALPEGALIVLSFDLHEMPNMTKHACEHRCVGVLRRSPDLAEPERTDSSLVPLALPHHAPDLRNPKLAHSETSLSSSDGSAV